jgi:hypothetical protein
MYKLYEFDSFFNLIQARFNPLHVGDWVMMQLCGSPAAT